MMKKINDEKIEAEKALIAGLKKRDESAFQVLHDTYSRRIYMTAYRILRDEELARDAIQESLINVYRAIKTFRGESKLSTWVSRITVNVCLEILRRNKKHQNRIEEDISESWTLPDTRALDPYRNIEQLELGHRVHSAMSRLGRKHLVVVKMHDLQGYTIKEIAENLEVAEGTIKSRLYYGREALKRQLAA
ncbi:MAG: RNA polymerase sigma factor [Acidobacteriota bacterium]